MFCQNREFQSLPTPAASGTCVRWGFALLALAAFIPFTIMIIGVLHFWLLPLLFFALGIWSYLRNSRQSLCLFLFLLPLVNALPDLVPNGYPFNYMGIILFLLAGIVAASFLKREKPAINGGFAQGYLFFLLLLHVSAFFVWLRWSNVTLGARYILKNTPVNPAGDRLSFAAIFPLVTLAIFSLAPYALALMRRHRFLPQDAMRPLLAGFFLSLTLALVQRFLQPEILSQGWWNTKMQQPNGGFSDFNAFGFFSGALFFYLLVLMTRTLRIRQKKNKDFLLWSIAMPVSLFGVFLSGSRSSFIFVLLGLIYIFGEFPKGWLIKAAAATLIIVFFILAGGTLKRRMVNMVQHVTSGAGNTSLVKKLDLISNGRLQMIANSLPTIKRHPLSGVGTGNFLLYFRFLYHGDGRYEDMPLNQYLMILDENGIVGLGGFLFFLVFLFYATGSKGGRFLWAGCAFAILVNNHLWFPEVSVLLWIFAALECDKSKPLPISSPLLRWVALLVMGVFVLASILDFQSLHPKNLAQQRGTRYDYGFWYTEKDSQGREFNWTTESSGIYIVLDQFGKSTPITISCGAPLPQIPGRRQQVDLFWQGERQQRLIFEQNSSETVQIRGIPQDRGFFEISVNPVFNLKSMGLGPESRTLGVQLNYFPPYGHK
jgi:O-antigen ligase